MQQKVGGGKKKRIRFIVKFYTGIKRRGKETIWEGETVRDELFFYNCFLETKWDVLAVEIVNDTMIVFLHSLN